MFQFPSSKEITTLKQVQDEFCVTIYAPYIEPSGSANPNKIELKKILHQVEDLLKERGADKKTLEAVVYPIRDFLQSDQVQPQRRASTAIFAAPGFFRQYFIPEPSIEYLATVQQGFLLDPLINTKGSSAYYVLALSHHSVQLYRGDDYGLRLVDVELPGSLRQALQIDEMPRSFETHSVAAADRAGSEELHNQFDKSKIDKAWLKQYFRQIDQILHPYLKEMKVPLVLAGVEYILPIYREVNTYPHICDHAITGNVEHLEERELYKKALEVLQHESFHLR